MMDLFRIITEVHPRHKWQSKCLKNMIAYSLTLFKLAELSIRKMW